VYQDFDPSSPQFFAFSLPFVGALLLGLALEFLEDVITHFNIVPEPPADEFDCGFYGGMEADDMRQIFGTTHVATQACSHESPWRSHELNAEGLKSKSAFDDSAECATKTLSIGFASSNVDRPGDVFRRRYGQMRRMQRATSLHGLRKLTIYDHVGPVAVMLGTAAVFIEVMVGPGYLRGVCSQPPPMTSSCLQGLWQGYPYICGDFRGPF